MFNISFDRSAETFDIDKLGKYRCPRWIAGRDIIDIRNSHLINDFSKTNQFFEQWINSIYSSYEVGAFSCIKEFPLPIINYQLYNEIAFNVGGRILLNEVRNNYFFMADYFFYNLGILVELDSHWHDKKKPADLVRDLYLEQEYKLNTLRVDGFWSSK